MNKNILKLLVPYHFHLGSIDMTRSAITMTNQVQLFLQVDNCTNNATKLDCSCLESTIFADPGVKAAAGTCGCGCMNCCYDALNAGGWSSTNSLIVLL